jgi:hypothetical protein
MIQKAGTWTSLTGLPRDLGHATKRRFDPVPLHEAQRDLIQKVFRAAKHPAWQVRKMLKANRLQINSPKKINAIAQIVRLFSRVD